MPLLSLEHVAKTHWVGPYEKRTLEDVSLSLDRGDFVGIWGARRSGKSTLIRVAAGLELPDTGTVRFQGQDLATLSDSERGELRLHQIGVLHGDGPRSAELNLVDYIALPLLDRHPRRQARLRAMTVLRHVGIPECHDAKWRHLSDCERALASVAHGLAREPRLLLADDPSLQLDPLQQTEVIGLLRTAATAAGVAVLMTSSALSALSGAHAAYTLGDSGLKLVADRALDAEVLEFPRREHTS